MLRELILLFWENSSLLVSCSIPSTWKDLCKEKLKENGKLNLWSSFPKKHIAFIGYGDIGTACAKICKLGFGMKVTGLKRSPDSVTEEQRSYCDEVVGNDQYDRVLSEADFVCGILPKVAGVTDDFFNE